MVRTVLAVVLSLAFATVILASPKTVKLKGYVVPNNCATSHQKNPDFAKFVETHPKKCALAPGCVRSGYSLIVDGERYVLDAVGNKQVGEILRSTTREEGLYVSAEGTVVGHTFKVRTISEGKS